MTWSHHVVKLSKATLLLSKAHYCQPGPAMMIILSGGQKESRSRDAPTSFSGGVGSMYTYGC